MNKIRKILTIVSVSTMAIAVIMLISAVFGAKVFQGIALNFLLTFAVISVASAFAINSLNVLKTQKIVAYISLALLALSSLFGIITFWTNFSNALFGQITAILAIATAFFCIIISTNNKVQKRFLVLQIITYAIAVFIDIILTLLIVGVSVFKVNGMVEIFIVACLVAFALLCALGILGKKKDNTEDKLNKVEKVDYQALLNKIQKLEEENAKLKEENQKLKQQLNIQ